MNKTMCGDDMRNTIDMAREARLSPVDFLTTEQIKAFEALVRADERCEIVNFANSEAFNRQHGERSPYAYELVAFIRARGNT